MPTPGCGTASSSPSFTRKGIRLSELAGIRYHPNDPRASDIDLWQREVRVRGKRGRERIVKIGHQAALSLDRYLRARSRHAQAWRPQLWLGVNNREPLTADGIYQMIARRGGQAGVAVYPHWFRHHFSHTWQMGRVASIATFPQKCDHDAVKDADWLIAGTPTPAIVNPQVRASA